MKKQIFAAFLALFLMAMLPGTARAAGDEAGLSDSRTRSVIFTIQTKPPIHREEPTEPEDPADVNQTEILPEDDSSEDEKQKEKDEDDEDEDDEDEDEDEKEENNPEENNQSAADEGSSSGTPTLTIVQGKTLPADIKSTSPPQTLRDQTNIDDDSVNHTISGEITPENRLARPEQNSYTVEIARPKENKPAAAPGKLSGATVISPPAAPAFMDVRQDDWFFKDVKWACEEGFMTGMSDNSFAPMDDVSRAVIVVVLSRMAGADLSRFQDLPDSTVAAGKWYTGAAIWAKQSGLLPADSVFTGNAAVSREEMAVILSKYLQNMGKDTTVPARIIEFADAEDMSRAGNDAFQVLCACNVFSGTGGGRMNPAGSMTRAQFAALVHRIADIP